MNDPYEALSGAIIMQAVSDYRSALRKCMKRSKCVPAMNTITEVEHFFRSEWFQQLTLLDGELLLMRLKAEVDD